MSPNAGRRFGEGMAQDPRIQRLTDDLAICASIVLAEEWVMRAPEECGKRADLSGLVFGNLTVLPAWYRLEVAPMLLACRERPRRRCAAEKRDEVAPRHSITWSARCWRNQGTSSPRALA